MVFMCLAVGLRSHLPTALGFGRAPNAEESQTGLIGMWFNSKELTDWKDETKLIPVWIKCSHAAGYHSVNRVICLTMPLDLLRVTPAKSQEEQLVAIDSWKASRVKRYYCQLLLLRGTAPCLVPENTFRGKE
ncbi:hypothetical protein Celaphus_00013363 [Cervus elaphus hippelaphus]|uniref:Uncharacterized protein n=1 Tax=Cervus elaphus hippelaphus TaxID=46360 RepID=A0A212DGV8_CEREH|nr:hypothetical protein Celaphus_00013363 [Cervus elaphus hippelaphus]